MGSWGYGPLDNDDAQDWLTTLGLKRKIEMKIERFLRVMDADAKHNTTAPRPAKLKHDIDYIADETVAALHLATLTNNDILGGSFRIPSEKLSRLFVAINESDKRRGWRNLRARQTEMDKLMNRLGHHEAIARLAPRLALRRRKK